jgi:hypothetical protein
MSEPDRVFCLHFRLEGEVRQMISTGPDIDQVVETLAFMLPDAFLSQVEDLGPRSSFTDAAFAQLAEPNVKAKYGIP